MPKKSKKQGLKKAVRRRHMYKPPVDPNRKLVSRLEVAQALGCSMMTVKRMEKQYGGPLDGVKLRGPQSATHYHVEQINQRFGIDINAA